MLSHILIAAALVAVTVGMHAAGFSFVLWSIVRHRATPPTGPSPMSLQFWPGAVVMMLIATLTASLVINNGRSAWFVGVLVLMVDLVFAMTLYLLPPRAA